MTIPRTRGTANNNYRNKKFTGYHNNPTAGN